MRRRLTKRIADGFVPGSKDAFLWDSDLPGFGLRGKAWKGIYALDGDTLIICDNAEAWVIAN